MSTASLSASKVKRSWHLVDVDGQVLGRAATNIAAILLGKKKPEYVPYLDVGDYVVVINASTVKVTGKKEQQKKYYRHSGYPGGFKEQTLSQLRKAHPDEVVRKAVRGMIPKTKLGRQMIKKMYVFASSEHPFEDKFKGDKK